MHISALPIAGAAVREYFEGDMSEGDLFVLNDTYFGGSHLPDITIIRPVFYQGELLFYGVNRAHHSELGGGTHGGYNPAASEIYQEGIRIPPLRLYDKGVPREDVLQMIAANVRQSENFLGDLNAQIGSVMIAEQRIQAVLESYGPERLTAAVNDILAATEKQVREFISQWPDGVYRGESLVDADGFDGGDPTSCCAGAGNATSSTRAKTANDVRQNRRRPLAKMLVGFGMFESGMGMGNSSTGQLPLG